MFFQMVTKHFLNSRKSSPETLMREFIGSFNIQSSITETHSSEKETFRRFWLRDLDLENIKKGENDQQKQFVFNLVSQNQI